MFRKRRAKTVHRFHKFSHAELAANQSLSLGENFFTANTPVARKHHQSLSFIYSLRSYLCVLRCLPSSNQKEWYKITCLRYNERISVSSMLGSVFYHSFCSYWPLSINKGFHSRDRFNAFSHCDSWIIFISFEITHINSPIFSSIQSMGSSITSRR